MTNTQRFECEERNEALTTQDADRAETAGAFDRPSTPHGKGLASRVGKAFSAARSGFVERIEAAGHFVRE